MTELQRLLRAYDEHCAAGRACALATVVDVAGSAYRRPGARMLVTADGLLTGSISGGCLEGDARRRARHCLESGQPQLITYDSTDPDDDLQFGAALGCQGVVQILLEPLDFSSADNALELLRAWADEAVAPAVMATVFSQAGAAAPARLGERLLLQADGRVRGTLAPASPLYNTIMADARAALAAGRPATHSYAAGPGTVQVSLEILRPPLRLRVFGAGNDVQPLVRLAAGLGWRVEVADGRPALAQPARFPEAQVVRVLPIAQLPSLPLDDSYAVLMSHNYHYDLAVLQHLLAAPPPYIGLLGPRKKYEHLLAELCETNSAAAELLRPCLHSPVGLNLGAETPEEIALSIVAEIQAVAAGRSGGFLRDSPLPIHAPLHRVGEAVASTPVAAVCSR